MCGVQVSEDMLDSDGDVNSADDAPEQPIVAPRKKTKWSEVDAGPKIGGDDDGGDEVMKRAKAMADAALAAGNIGELRRSEATATDRLSDQKVAFSMPGMR